MIRKLRKIIEKDDLFHSNHKLLLSVSGGVDSMVMCDLLRNCGNTLTIIHFNHQKRTTESDLEAQLVERYCRDYKIPFIYHVLSFDSLETDKNSNFQDIARNERYRILEMKRRELNYDFILTAHHEDDSIESFFMHILRGSGWLGMRGMETKKGLLIRPLLKFQKKEILDYAKINNISFLEDSSNLSAVYRRNFIRLKILPLLNNFRPGTKKAIIKTIENIRESHLLLQYFLKNLEGSITQIQDNQLIIDKTILKTIPGKSVVLFHLLSKYGFNRSQVLQLTMNFDRPGLSFQSPSHHLTNERNQILVDPHQQFDSIRLEIKQEGNYPLPDGQLFSISSVNEFDKVQDNQIEYVDAEKLVFPLTLRQRKDGDSFQPLGMGGKTKKLKDFLSDLKISNKDKQALLLLESDNQIVWVVKHRVDERFKITEMTHNVIQLKIES